MSAPKGRKPKKQMLPSYRNPPVVEVVCGVSFEAINELKGPHFGLFWADVLDEYPNCEEAARLGFDEKLISAEKGFPMPRLWLISRDGNILIQLQNDRFLCNWRKVNSADIYPRYDTVIEVFKRNFGKFELFLAEQNIGSLSVTDCELTYINHIAKGEGWESLADIGSVFDDLGWANIERFLPAPTTLVWAAVFSMPEDAGNLHAKLQSATRRIDNRPVITLELTARGLGGDKSPEGLWKWFDVAHEWIVEGFTDLTTEAMHSLWERER